mgnify:CR=1 FL=1
MVLGAEDWKIGFIGGGNMAGAIIGGVTSCGKISPHRIFVYDRHSEKLDSLKQKYGVNSAESDVDVAKICDIIFLAVKPQNFTDLLRSLKHTVTEKKVFVSIAACLAAALLYALCQIHRCFWARGQRLFQKQRTFRGTCSCL